MNLKQLEYLMHVASHGSFSRAAAVLGIAQPALGRQVQKLEADCGERLLHRSGRGVTLTPAGEEFIAKIRPLVEQLRSIAAEMQEDRNSPSGVISVGLTPTVAMLLGRQLLTTIRQKFPRIRVQIASGYSGLIHEWLVNARVDIAILHDARRSTHLAVEGLADAGLWVVSAPDPARAPSRPRSCSLSSLARLPLVLPSANHGLRRTLEAAAARAGVALDVRFEVDSLTLMKSIARAGQAHTVLSLPAVQEELRARKLMARRLVRPCVHTRLMLARSANRPHTRAIRMVEDEIRAAIRHEIRQNSSLLDLHPPNGSGRNEPEDTLAAL